MLESELHSREISCFTPICRHYSGEYRFDLNTDRIEADDFGMPQQNLSLKKEKRRWQKQLYRFLNETEKYSTDQAGRSQDYTNPAYEGDPEDPKNKEAPKRSWSMVLRQVIEQQDDDDLHPYGRGGIYHNIIYGRNVKVKYDHSKMFVWVVLVTCLVLGSGAIIFASEMTMRHGSTVLNTTSSTSLN